MKPFILFNTVFVFPASKQTRRDALRIQYQNETERYTDIAMTDLIRGQIVYPLPHDYDGRKIIKVFIAKDI